MDDANTPRLNRREVLAGGVSLAAGAGTIRPRRDLIGRENARDGSRDWQLTRVRINEGKWRTSLIEGYCSQQSYRAGDTLRICVSTDPARRFHLDLFRMGYYGGTGARRVRRWESLPGTTQPVPALGPLPGRLRECRWEPSLEVTIPEEWPSGVYLGKLTTVPEAPSEPYWQSYIVFVIRDERPADLLFQVSDNTWQAYNQWPVAESLYTHPDGGHAAGVAVSFDRPYGMYTQIFQPALSIGSGEFLLWEFPLCFWLEQHGYDVTYASNSDCLDPAALTRARTFLSVGHDEYWDQKQYAAAEAAIQAGVSYLWLSGNSVFVTSPYSASHDGRPKRIITRTGTYGALREEERVAYPTLFPGITQQGPDERRIIGARSVVPFNGGGDWTCVKPEHWAFEGTKMRRGDSIPGLVGWEHHGDPDPNRAGLEVLAEGSVWAGGTTEGRYAATIFPGPTGNPVFNAATIFWSQGLSSPPGHILPWSHWSRPHGPDARVQRITRNVLRRALGSSGKR